MYTEELASYLRQRNGPMHALGLGLGRTSERVILRRRLAIRQCLLDDGIDDDAILGMHADQPTVLARHAHRFEDGGVIDQKHSRIGHEQFEARNSLIDHRPHLRQPLVRQIGADEMEPIVDRRLPIRLGVPRIHSLLQRLPLVLHGKVDDGGSPPMRRRNGPRLERVGRRSPPKRQLHVRMRIDPTRDHQPPLGVDDRVRIHLDRLPDRDDGAAVNEDVRVVVVNSGDDASVFDEGCGHDSLSY